MFFRLPFAAAALLAVAAGPILAQTPASEKHPEKPSAAKKVAGKTLDQWVKEITDGRDPGRRETAIRAVAYFGKSAVPEAVKPLLARVQRDPDTACRVYAALTLSGLASHIEGDAASEAVGALIERARYDTQAIVRLHVVWALGSFGPTATAAIPVLIRHIRDPISWELRQAALSSLASIAKDFGKAGPDKDAVAAVAKLLSTGDEKSAQVRLAAVSALGAMGKPDDKELKLATDALEKATRDPDKTVSIWAWVALMTLDKVTEERLSTVAQNLKVKDPMVKVTAALALSALKKDALPRLGDIIDLLDDSDPLVVATAIDVLAGFGKAAGAAVPALRKVMGKKEHADYFAQAAAAALTKITGTEVKAPAVAEKTSALTKVPDPKEIGGKTLDQWIKEIKSNPDPSAQQTAMRVVPFFGDKAGAAAPALIARLRSQERPDIACRAHAVLTLATIAGHVSDEDAGKAVKAVTNVLENDGQVIMRFHAAGALGAFGHHATSAIPALINSIQDANSWELRQAAVASLSTIAAGGEHTGPDGRAVVAIANRLLKNYENSGAVRTMSVMALGALGRPANPNELSMSLQALQKASHSDPDKAVEIWAEVALMAVDKVTDKGLDDVAKHITKGKDVVAKLTAARALGAMGKEAKSKVGDIAKMLDDDDPTVMAGALDVLAGFGTTARAAIPAVERFAEKLDQNMTMKKEQREYFKAAAKYTIQQIEGEKR
jgi:HEAT repeat protein